MGNRGPESHRASSSSATFGRACTEALRLWLGGWSLIESEEGWAAIGYPETHVGWLADLFASLCRWGLASLLDSKRAERFYREARDRHVHENKGLALKRRNAPERDIFLESREPDLKNAALYVDLSTSGAVQSPEGRVGSGAADSSIRGLEYFLREYRPIPEVLSDDSLWDSLAADVRARVT